MSKIEVKNICYYYKNELVLKDITFTFEEGKTYILAGHNGAGKTTLIRCILNILKCKSGSVLNLDNLRYSYIPDFDGIYNYLTVKENLEIFYKLNNYDMKDSNTTCKKMIEKWKLNDKKDARVNSLSNGQRKRLSIMTADTHYSNAIFYDEPTNGIDITSKELLIEFIRELKKKSKIQIIATHDIDLMKSIGDVILIINNGKLVYSGEIKKVVDLVELYNDFTDRSGEVEKY